MEEADYDEPAMDSPAPMAESVTTLGTSSGGGSGGGRYVRSKAPKKKPKPSKVAPTASTPMPAPPPPRNNVATGDTKVKAVTNHLFNPTMRII
jgi:hypothetical protein